MSNVYYRNRSENELFAQYSSQNTNATYETSVFIVCGKYDYFVSFHDLVRSISWAINLIQDKQFPDNS